MTRQSSHFKGTRVSRVPFFKPPRWPGGLKKGIRISLFSVVIHQ